MPTIRLQTCINAPIEHCFDLARSIEAHCRSVGHTRERAVAGKTTGYLDLGDSVAWEAVHFGLRLRMTVSIIEYERPYRFVDEMVSGPFRALHHTHEFTVIGDGTTMTDVFRYAVAFGLLGSAADRLLLRGHLRRLLSTRNAALKRMAEAPGG